MTQVVLLLQAATTLAMVGLIWFVQVLHYPLFGHVGRDEFPHYKKVHQTRTTMVLAPLMLVELLAAFLLLWLRPEGVAFSAALVGVFLVAAI